MHRTVSDPMIEALRAEGPYAPYADKLSLFGRLVGSWDIEGAHFDSSGKVIKEQRGEWHFGWVLEGRVIQDVIITPPRVSRKAGEQSAEYGVAVRAYDPNIDAWRVTALAPVYGAMVNLIAREHADGIWQEGRFFEDGPLVRWTFSEITDDRALWQGYATPDGGKTWIRDEQIVLRRRVVS